MPWEESMVGGGVVEGAEGEEGQQGGLGGEEQGGDEDDDVDVEVRLWVGDVHKAVGLACSCDCGVGRQIWGVNLLLGGMVT